ncbi:MAG: hypothetical protein ACLS4Z_00905 [Christensenellaceae bacterium]
MDFILYVLDGHEGVREEDFSLIRKYKALGIPMAVAYTKIDIMPRENIPLDMARFAESGVDLDVFPVSARKGQNVKRLKEFLISAMPEGEKIFQQDVVSDKSERFMIAEIMREKFCSSSIRKSRTAWRSSSTFSVSAKTAFTRSTSTSSAKSPTTKPF